MHFFDALLKEEDYCEVGAGDEPALAAKLLSPRFNSMVIFPPVLDILTIRVTA